MADWMRMSVLGGMLMSELFSDFPRDGRPAVFALPGRIDRSLFPGEILSEPEGGAARTGIR